MNIQRKLKIALLTGMSDNWIADLILKIKAIPELEFEQVIYWREQQSAGTRIRKNIKKHGLPYIPWRALKYFNDFVTTRIYSRFESAFFSKSIGHDLFSVCAEKGIAVHRTADVHSKESLEHVRSLDCDLLVVCGTGIIKRPLIKLGKIGMVNLHQGEVPKYRGAPPGFWELWNNESQAGVTVHFIDEGVDTGDVIAQTTVPIFGYDDHSSVRLKLSETSLSFYPWVLQSIARGEYHRTAQSKEGGRHYRFPTILQMLRLHLRIKIKQIHLTRFLKRLIKRPIIAILLLLIRIRDWYLCHRGKSILSVLYYHRVTDICRDGMTVGVNAFEKQIRFLKKNYRILSAKEFLDWPMRNKQGRGEKAVLITFDDGYEDNYTNVFPILKKYSVPALFFISTGYIQNDRQFEHDAELQPRLTFRKLSWYQIQEMKQHGIEIGIHADHHHDLGAIPYEAGVQQVDRSLQIYSEHLGGAPAFMSYPFGGKKNITQDLISYIKDHSGIGSLFSAYGNKNIGPANRYDIKRINIGYEDGRILNFWFKLEGGLQTLLWPRESRESVTGILSVYRRRIFDKFRPTQQQYDQKSEQ